MLTVFKITEYALATGLLVGFATVYRRIYHRKYFSSSKQMWRNIRVPDKREY